MPSHATKSKQKRYTSRRHDDNSNQDSNTKEEGGVSIFPSAIYVDVKKKTENDRGSEYEKGQHVCEEGSSKLPRPRNGHAYENDVNGMHRLEFVGES